MKVNSRGELPEKTDDDGFYMKKYWFVGVGLLVVILAVTVVLRLGLRPYAYHGSLMNPATPAHDFVLRDQTGQSYQLSAQRGKVVLIYFGYTHCPDECPATLANFKQVRSGLGSQESNVELVFITTDPARDTQARLKDYLAHFDPGIVGLSGPVAELSPVWKAYGVYSAADTATQSGGGYQVTHSDFVYVIDRQGNLRLTYAYGETPNNVLQDVQQLVRGN